MNSICIMFFRRMMLFVLKFVIFRMMAVYNCKQEVRSMESGFIWAGEHVDTRDNVAEDQKNNTEEQISKFSRGLLDIPIETRRNICRIANTVRVLSTLCFNITLEVIQEIMNLSSTLSLSTDEMLGPEFHVLAAEREAERRSSLTKKKR